MTTPCALASSIALRIAPGGFGGSEIGTGFGHLALGVPDIYGTCEQLQKAGVKINVLAFEIGAEDIKKVANVHRVKVKLRPQAAEAWQKLGLLSTYIDQWDSAVDALREAVRLKPDLAAQGARRTGAFFEGQGSSIGHDDRVDYSVHMEAGKCYWVVGCGEPGKVKALYLYMWGPDNKRITEAKSDSSTPMVGHCAKETGIFKVQAKMAGGKGQFKVGVYVK